MTTQSLSQTSAHPQVLIIGAGLGGLTMAILLERAGFDYLVLEKSSEVRALGSATNLGPNVQPMFEQLGLFEKLEAISKPSSEVNIYNERLEQIGGIDYSEYQPQCGYVSRTMARPDLHKLLLDEVPASKIVLGKKIIRIEQSPTKVTVHCADESTYEAGFLIGADGAYSKVRQSLFQQMEATGVGVPKADTQNLKAWHMSVLGITGPLDPERYPVIKESGTRYESVIGENKPNTWRYFSIPGRICWRIDYHIASSDPSSLTKSLSVVSNDNNTVTPATNITAATNTNNKAEWGTEQSARTIPEAWRTFPIPIGGTMGDLVDLTPPEVISKVMLEEKLYKTWFHQRVVLIGDACHKMLPNSGRGAVNAMLDAIVLANALFDHQVIQEQSLKNVKGAFKQYYNERYPHAVDELERSKRMARVVAGQTWFDIMARKAFFSLFPKSFRDNSYAAMLRYRPQLKYIPPIQDRGQNLVLSPKAPGSRPSIICWQR
ncbi:hypothetical protein BGZ83_011958 [Gryganskiella cystojenkinii]|nr:hypothetical protein BGZ83_011958 [Gryganskiella cystojenkinii]